MKRRLIVNTRKLELEDKVIGPCSIHSNRNIKSKSSNSNTHVRSVQCHEETMSKLSSHCVDECFENGLVYCVCSPHMNHERILSKDKKKNEISKFVCSKFNDNSVCETASAPLKGREKNIYHKTPRSKSIPFVENPSHQESVDFIPVKLSSNSDFQNRSRSKNRQKIGNDLKPVHKEDDNRNKTWDEILRGQCKTLAESEKYKDKLLKCGRSNVDNFHSSESCQNTPKTKVSRPKSFPTRKHEPIANQFNSLHKNSSSFKTIQPSFNPFIDSDPVNTLEFLIKQLREKLVKKPENKNLQQIIIEMENALLKISAETHPDPIVVEDENVHATGGMSSEIASKYSTNNNIESKDKIGQVDYGQFKEHCGESCLFLQNLYVKQKESCDNHLREKEQLAFQLAESRRLLTVAKSKEKEYEINLSELRSKLQETESNNNQQSETVQELLDKITSLTTENETLAHFREASNTLDSRLKHIILEKEVLESRLYLKDLEIEKLKVLLETKQNDKTSSNPHNKELLERFIKNTHAHEEIVENKNNSILSLSTMTSWSQDKPGLVCSSQASSSPRHSPSPYNSWQHISDICRRPDAVKPIAKDMAEKIKNLEKLVDGNDQFHLDLEEPSSANSIWSDKLEQDINSKMVFSDNESGTLSS